VLADHHEYRSGVTWETVITQDFEELVLLFAVVAAIGELAKELGVFRNVPPCVNLIRLQLFDEGLERTENLFDEPMFPHEGFDDL
jgi:hypothetical protein